MFTAALKMFLNSSAVAAVTDAYFNLVTLLLPGNGTNGAQNNTFLDSSSNNFTITRNGNTTQGTFSPFSQTGWSNYFDGSSYIEAPSNAVFGFGTGNYTIEGWIFIPTTPSANIIFVDFRSSTPAAGQPVIYINTSSVPFLFLEGTGNLVTGTALATGTWHHIAGVKNSGTYYLYINGSSVGTPTANAVSVPTSKVRIGRDYSGAAAGLCYISNLRTTNAALYTFNFTPSTTPLTTTVSSGTVSLLTCQSNRFVDNSSNAFALTISGSPSIQAFSPFAPTAAYDAATVGGSGYFDGTGDYLQTPSNTALAMGTGDFQIEFWAYHTSVPASFTYIDTRPSGTNGSYITLGYNNSGDGIFLYVNGMLISTGLTPVANAWTHFVLSRVGSTTRLFRNGSQIGSASDGTNYAIGDQGMGIGGNTISASNYFFGYMAGFRVVKGSGVTSVTVPTTPPTAITNTSLLLNFTNAGIIDSTAKNDLETVGNAQISTTQSKFGGSSMYFDGTGDYVSATPKIQSNAVQGGNSTIEMWVYTSNSSSSLKCLVDTRSAQNTDTGFGVYQIANNVVIYGAGVKGNAVGQLTGNAWVHLAVTRANTTNYVFIGGTLYNTFSYGNTLTSSNVTIGSDVAGSNAFTGYIDDLRITNGFARYTANFTPTTTAFPLQ